MAVEANDQQQRACEPDEDHVSLVREETGIRIGLLLGLRWMCSPEFKSGSRTGLELRARGCGVDGAVGAQGPAEDLGLFTAPSAHPRATSSR